MPFKHNYIHMKNEEGSGLILAIMTLLVLSVLGASLGAVTVGSFKLGDVNRDDASAYYIAEAGANMAYEEIKTGVLAAYSKYPDAEGLFYNEIDDKINNNRIINLVNGKIYDDFDDQFGDLPAASISITEPEGSNPKNYTIVSTGDVAGKSRTVRKPIEVTWVSKNSFSNIPSLPDQAALISKGKMDLGQSVIEGDVLISSMGMLSEKNQTKITGDTIVHSIDWPFYSQLITEFPDFKTLDNQTQPSSIHLEDKKRNVLILDTFDFSQDFKISGDGTLDIFIKNELNIPTGGIFNKGGSSKNVRIFYSGDSDIDIKNHFLMNASLFIEKADLYLKPNSTVSGLVLTGGSVNIKGNRDENTPFTIIAPNNSVVIETNVNINGIILGENISVGNNSELFYKESQLLPFTFGDKENSESSETEEGKIITSEPAIESD